MKMLIICIIFCANSVWAVEPTCTELQKKAHQLKNRERNQLRGQIESAKEVFKKTFSCATQACPKHRLLRFNIFKLNNKYYYKLRVQDSAAEKQPSRVKDICVEAKATFQEVEAPFQGLETIAQ